MSVMNDPRASKIRRMLERDEGIRLKPYKCSQGFLTIGIGRNLDSVGISKATAYQMLDEDVEAATRGCKRIFEELFDTWSENRQLGWINLAFNLGFASLSQFRNTIRAARVGDWQSVELGLRKSLWCKQVGSRSERVIKMICEEAYPYD
jgi:lysozyme